MKTKKNDRALYINCPLSGCSIPLNEAAKRESSDAGKQNNGGVGMTTSTPCTDKISQIINEIDNSGYLDVNGIVRRWIPSQCLSMVYSNVGFHTVLKNRGVNYAWEVVLNELEKQAELYHCRDINSFNDRNRWYSKEIVYAMAERYVELLTCNDRMSIYLKPLKSALKGIKGSLTPFKLYKTAQSFNAYRKRIPFSQKGICNEFANAYKAAGAYYTMKDLIMFEGCSFDTVDKSKESHVIMQESLDILEQKADEIVKDGVCDNGYKMLAILKKFLKDNEFDFDKTKEKWATESNARRALRALIRTNRRSRK